MMEEPNKATIAKMYFDLLDAADRKWGYVSNEKEFYPILKKVADASVGKVLGECMMELERKLREERVIPY